LAALSLCPTGGKHETSSPRAVRPPARTRTPRLQCVWRTIGNDHLRRVLRAPSRRGPEQEEARGAGRRVVALGIGHFHADKSQLERHVRRDWFRLNQKLRHFSVYLPTTATPEKSRMKTSGRWLLLEYKGLALVILSKPFKTKKLAEKARRKYPERMARKIGIGMVRAPIR